MVVRVLFKLNIPWRRQNRKEISDYEIYINNYQTLGAKTAFQARLPGVSVGSHRVECYAEYIRDGEARKTNVVFTQILGVTGTRGWKIEYSINS